MALSSAFAQQSGRTEEGFFQLGDMLRELHTDAAGLTDLVREGASNLRSVVDQNRVSGPDGLAAQSLSELRTILGETSHLMQSLREVGAALQQLQKEIQGIQRISMCLKVSVIGFAVESVRTPQCYEAFSAFVGELRTLSTRVTELGDRISDELRETETAQSKRLDTIAADFDQIGNLTDRLEHTWNDTATEVQEFLDASVVAVQETEEGALKIANHAGEAVYYMQFGDIVRQKSEHVVASLQEAAARLAESTSAKDAQSKCAAAENIVAIQISQLKLIRQEVLAARSKIATDLDGIASETEHLAESLQHGNQTNTQRLRGGHPIARLTANANHVEELRAQGHQLGLDARKTARETVEGSARLAEFLDQVRGINADMHLQALNAIVKTALLDKQGATLEVLSMEVDRLFRESNQKVEKIVGTLQSMVLQANENPDVSANALTPVAEVDSGLRAGLENIKQACEQFRSLSDRARSVAQKQRSWVACGGDKLQFLEDLARALDQDLEIMEDIRLMLASSASAQPGAAELSIDDGRYTMQSERDVHRSVIGSSPLPAVMATLPAPSAHPLLPASDVLQLDTIADSEQPQQSETGRAEPAPAEGDKTSEPAYGDNVELF